MGAPKPIPLDLRIDLAEAVVELSWKRIPKPRTGVIEQARWRVTYALQLAEIDYMLDQLGVMYLERAGQQPAPDHYAPS
jgi:hypothetical protein